MSLAGNLSRRLELDKMFVTVGEEVVFVGQRDGFWNASWKMFWIFGGGWVFESRIKMNP